MLTLDEVRKFKKDCEEANDSRWKNSSIYPLVETLLAALLVVEAAKNGRCPNCPDQGWYVVPDRNTGDVEQEQCQWCCEMPGSLFNAMKPFQKGEK